MKAEKNINNILSSQKTFAWVEAESRLRNFYGNLFDWVFDETTFELFTLKNLVFFNMLLIWIHLGCDFCSFLFDINKTTVEPLSHVNITIFGYIKTHFKKLKKLDVNKAWPGLPARIVWK